MKTRLALLTALAILATGVTAVFADSNGDDFNHYYQVRGKKGRKYIRHFLLQKNLTGDKKRIFDEYGWTPHRLRFDFAGRITERWIYYPEGLYFLFDNQGNLIEERHVPRETGHIE